jgi:3-phenylpropionate/trans-cinnamate dioxygenase ferredoxin reductase subunit
VLAGIGIVPNAELAAAAGLACADGVRVDDHARTSDPDVVAFGDCATAPNAFLGREVRLETVHNAVEQSKTAAATLVGRSAPYRQVPWVWSDQLGYRIQMVGDCAGDAVVMRGGADASRFTVLHYAGDALRGVTAVNRPADFGAARRLLQMGVPVPREFATDPARDLGALLPRRERAAFELPWRREAARVAGRST